MLTGENGSITISGDDTHVVAAFSNGVMLMAQGAQASPAVRNVRHAMRTTGVPLVHTYTLLPSEISDIHNEFDRQNATGGSQVESLARRRVLQRLVHQAGKDGSSDIHIKAYKDFALVIVRTYGRMMIVESLPREEAMAVIEAAFSDASGTEGGSSLFVRQGALMPSSGLLASNVAMIRMQYTPTEHGGSLVMRLNYGSNPKNIDLMELGYSDEHVADIEVMKRRTNGLYILSGKVSSGKSTTLQRVLNGIYLDNNREIEIYTIEEPVELNLLGGTQFTATPQPDNQNPGGKIDGFEAGIRTALRSDINVGVLGEIRSGQIAQHAVQLVLTGHALWTTLHAGSALQILERLHDIGVPKYKLADSDLVRGLIYQRLVGTLCPHCRIDYVEAVRQGRLKRDLAIRTCKLLGREPRQLFVRGEGCAHCRRGLNGRTVVAEVILPDETLLETFAAASIPKHLREYWLKPREEGGMGGKPVLHHALAKTGAGLCDINEIEQEVDLVSSYESKFIHLRPKLIKDIELIEWRLKKPAAKA